MKKRLRGMTLIELLLVMGIVSIVLAILSPSLVTWYAKQNLIDTSRRLRSMAVKAQIYAISAKSGASWGICIDQGSIFLFKSACQSDNFFDQLPISSPLSLTGDTSVIFEKNTGFPDSEKSFMLSNQVDAQTIYINLAGAIE